LEQILAIGSPQQAQKRSLPYPIVPQAGHLVVASISSSLWVMIGAPDDIR
jgi:hypothetical protein